MSVTEAAGAAGTATTDPEVDTSADTVTADSSTANVGFRTVAR